MADGIERKEEKVFTIGSQDYVLLIGEYDDYLQEKVLLLDVDVTGEQVRVAFDAFHVRELRLALTRLEKWINQ